MSLAKSYIKVVKVLAENIAQYFALNSRAENLDHVQHRLTVNYQHLFLHSISTHPQFQFWTWKDHFSRRCFAPISQLLVYVFSTGRPMGLLPCKPCISCLQRKVECGPPGGCSCACNDWRYCSDRCCDICCQMCVDVCSGLCSGDCRYTFCTLCLSLANKCVSLFTTQQTETSEA